MLPIRAGDRGCASSLGVIIGMRCICGTGLAMQPWPKPLAAGVPNLPRAARNGPATRMLLVCLFSLLAHPCNVQ